MAQATAGRAGLPRPGDVLHVTWEASVQFATPILFRVIWVHDWPDSHHRASRAVAPIPTAR